MGRRNSILARVVKSPPTEEQLAIRSERAKRGGWRVHNRRSFERVGEAGKIDWSTRPWFPGRLTGAKPVKLLMLEALDREAWRTWRDIRARMPAGAKQSTVGAFLFRECEAGRVEARPAFYERIFEKRHCRRPCKAYRLTRLGELYLRAKRDGPCGRLDRTAIVLD